MEMTRVHPMEIDSHSYYEFTIFGILPLEIVLKIFSFLDKDLVPIGKVCKYFNSVAFKELFDRGMYSMEVLQDNFKAIREFSRAIVLNPTCPSPHFKRGVAHYKENEEEEALRDLNKALAYKTSPVEEYLIRSMLYQVQLNFADAVKEASKAIELDPYNGAAYYLRGYNRFDLQDYEGSIADLTYCLQLSYPYKSKVLNCRGWCYKIRGQVDKALEDFTVSSRLNVRYTKPFVNKAIVLASKKDKPSVLEEEQLLTEYISKSSNEGNLGSIYYTRAAIRQQWENYQGAIADYRAAIENGYHSVHKSHVSVGWCFEKLFQFDKAIEEYNKAIELKPKYSIAIEHRAGAKCRTDGKAAEEDCRLAIKTNPKNLSFAYRYLAAVQADNNDYKGAISILSDGIKVNPLDTDMLLNRAGYYTCVGDLSYALQDYTTCIRHRPDTYEAWRYRGNVRHATGDLLGATQDYKNALLLINGGTLEMEDCAVINNCAMAHVALGEFDKAIELLNKGLTIQDAPSAMRDNLRAAQYIKDHGQLPRLFEPWLITDPVFEKDLEKKMKEIIKTKVMTTLKPPVTEMSSIKQKVLNWKQMANK